MEGEVADSKLERAWLRVQPAISEWSGIAAVCSARSGSGWVVIHPHPALSLDGAPARSMTPQNLWST
jgi:hypothetical protein